MALKKLVTLPTHVTVEYWRVTRVDINWSASRADIELAGYMTKVARDAGAIPLLSQFMMLTGSDFPFSVAEMDKANPIRVSYGLWKKNPDFSDAEDC